MHSVEIYWISRRELRPEERALFEQHLGGELATEVSRVVPDPNPLRGDGDVLCQYIHQIEGSGRKALLDILGVPHDVLIQVACAGWEFYFLRTIAGAKTLWRCRTGKLYQVAPLAQSAEAPPARTDDHGHAAQP